MTIRFATPRLPLVLGAGAVRAALPDGAFPGAGRRGGDCRISRGDGNAALYSKTEGSCFRIPCGHGDAPRRPVS